MKTSSNVIQLHRWEVYEFSWGAAVREQRTGKWTNIFLKPDGQEILEEYKASANTTIETYAQEKGQDNYTVENWAIIERLVTEGKAAGGDRKDQGRCGCGGRDSKTKD